VGTRRTTAARKAASASAATPDTPAVVRCPLGDATTFGYDASDHVTRTTGAAGHDTRYKYDDADRPRSVSGPDSGAVTWYDHDPAGHITARTDANGHTSKYGYDPAGRLASATDPLGRQTSYTYDAESNLTRTIAPGGGDTANRTIANSFDILGRQIGQDLANGGTIYAYNYDTKSRLISLADPGGLRHRRDGLSRRDARQQVGLRPLVAEWSSACAASTTVEKKGARSSARPISSSTTLNSTKPNPDPP
jgi:YD repeat-containing protein